MIVVDSSVWIDFFNGHATPAASRLMDLLGVEPLIVGDIILCEVLQGARTEEHARKLQYEMRRFETVRMLDSDLAIKAASNYRQLRGSGFTVRKTIDVIIGTYCIAHQHTLLHADRDFEPMERCLGLKVVSTGYSVNEPTLAYG